jgi:hypothetical protein
MGPQVIGRPVPTSLLILSVTLALLSAAAASDEAGDEIDIRIDTVLASNSDKPPTFDPALAALRRPFISLFPMYSSYRLVQGEQRRVNWRGDAEFILPGGRYLVVKPRGYKDGRILLNVMLIAGTRPLVNTNLALKNHGVFLVAGPRYADGTLIIAIGAGTTPTTGMQASVRTP